MLYGSEPDNDDRADWAENAVNAFAKVTYCGRTFTNMVIEQPDKGDDAYTMVQDLICDLLHLARRHKWDPEEVLRRAVSNFEDEELEAANEDAAAEEEADAAA